MLNRYSGCLLPRPNEFGSSTNFWLSKSKTELCNPVSPLRPISSTLGVHKDHKADNMVASYSNDSTFQLPGQLHPIRRICSSAVGFSKDNVGVTPMSRIYHKLGEVISNSRTRRGFSRCFLGSEERYSVSSAGKEESNRRSLSCSTQRKHQHSSLPGKPCGVAELRSILHSTRKTSSPSNYRLDELKHDLLQQGRSSTTDSSLNLVRMEPSS